jgi:hypothetical protein
MLSKTYRLLAVNIFLLSIVTISYFFGYIKQLFVNDVSHLTYVLALILIINIILRIYATFRYELDYRNYNQFIESYLDYVVSQILYIGILGTVIGFGHIMNSLQDMTDQAKVLAEMISGALTLFNTTAIGIVVYLWTRLNTFLSEAENEK